MLSHEQLQEFKAMLEKRYYELREEIRQALLKSDNEQYIDLAGQVHDLEDQAVADLLVDVNLAGVTRHINELREVEEALMRIAKGTYGVCVDTGEPIELARLKAQPTAKRTRAAQEAYERSHAVPGHSSL